MNLDFKKGEGLLPAIIQDYQTNRVLMLGYMNSESLEQTRQLGKVVFFSRSRQSLWVKGETSGNFLYVKKILTDCDRDTILIKAKPAGPVCHTGEDTCFKEENSTDIIFLTHLERLIKRRRTELPANSYTSSLFKKGLNKIAQKVGEEAAETIIEALNGTDAMLKEESADLIYHLLVLLAEKEIPLDEVINVLKERHQSA